jgi:hypothetical protein
MLSWVLAVFVILLGAKAFTKDGIPLTRTKNLHGIGGIVCGILCFLFAAFLILDGILGMRNIASIIRGD